MQCSAVLSSSSSLTVVVAGKGDSKRDTRAKQGHRACCLTAVTCQMMFSICVCSGWGGVGFFWLKKDHLVPTISILALFHSTHSCFLVFYGSRINAVLFVHINNVYVLLEITLIRYLELVGPKEQLLFHSWISLLIQIVAQLTRLTRFL